MSHVVQNVVIGAIVAASAFSVVKHVLPRQTRWVTQRSLDWLVRRGVTPARRWRDTTPRSSGCGTGCGSCASSHCESPTRESPIRIDRGKASQRPR
ncbi:DUF6587 family protein [Pandoraea bronchicola]|uniref:DUF6587 family protein n=1 Tax=Pandoraea bronchicola TaxID=2508287 RepID=UPI003CCDD026